MCRPISQRNFARMKFAPFGRDSMAFLCANRGQQVGRRVDGADHAGIAGRDFHELALVRGENSLRALVAAELDELLVEAPRNADRMAPPGTEVRGDERGPAFESLAHGGDRAAAAVTHARQPDEVAFALARSPA